MKTSLLAKGLRSSLLLYNPWQILLMFSQIAQHLLDLVTLEQLKYVQYQSDPTLEPRLNPGFTFGVYSGFTF